MRFTLLLLMTKDLLAEFKETFLRSTLSLSKAKDALRFISKFSTEDFTTRLSCRLLREHLSLVIIHHSLMLIRYHGTEPRATGFSTDFTRSHTAAAGLWGQTRTGGITLTAIGNVTYHTSWRWTTVDYSATGGMKAELSTFDQPAYDPVLENKDEIAVDYLDHGPWLCY